MILSKFLRKLGYIPIEELDKLTSLNNVLNKVIDSKNQIILDNEKEIGYLKDTLYDYKISNNILKERVEDLTKSSKKKDRIISDKQFKINKLSKAVKKLVSTKHKYKDSIKSLSLFNSKSMDLLREYQSKTTYLDLYSELLVERLEQIVFGSVLPKVMRNYGVEKYLYPERQIELKWRETSEGLQVYADQFSQSND